MSSRASADGNDTASLRKLARSLSSVGTFLAVSTGVRFNKDSKDHARTDLEPAVPRKVEESISKDPCTQRQSVLRSLVYPRMEQLRREGKLVGVHSVSPLGELMHEAWRLGFPALLNPFSCDPVELVAGMDIRTIRQRVALDESLSPEEQIEMQESQHPLERRTLLSVSPNIMATDEKESFRDFFTAGAGVLGTIPEGLFGPAGVPGSLNEKLTRALREYEQQLQNLGELTSLPLLVKFKERCTDDIAEKLIYISGPFGRTPKHNYSPEALGRFWKVVLTAIGGTKAVKAAFGKYKFPTTMRDQLRFLQHTKRYHVLQKRIRAIIHRMEQLDRRPPLLAENLQIRVSYAALFLPDVAPKALETETVYSTARREALSQHFKFTVRNILSSAMHGHAVHADCQHVPASRL